MTDENLMLSVANGDTEKLGVLFNRYQDKIYDYFLRMTKDEFLSGDLLQSVFEKVLRGKHTYRVTYPFVGWVFRIAKNVLMDHYRTEKMTIGMNDQVFNHKDSESISDETWEKSEIEIALDQMEEIYREVLILTRYEELKYKEVAEIIGVSETGVKTRVHRAIKQLRENYLKVSKG
ncbi:MAG: RNA polymerase sigma factor [Saprospiraceae bacterium]|nr:RNA polymerase sigma factor [Saprospiraceae bacterium]